MKETQEILDQIKLQREKQIEKGFSPESDSKYKNGELLLAGLTLVGFAHGQLSGNDATKDAVDLWPLGKFEPSEVPNENLITACSLIIAEIQRNQK